MSLILSMAWMTGASAASLELDFSVRSDDSPVSIGRTFDGGTNGSLTLKRLDFLTSGLALQRPDGAWVATQGPWVDFVSVGKNRLKVRADGFPEGCYQKIRFRIGIDPATDKVDPAVYPPSHPLHPDVCGLHWSWQGGYIYMALEGQGSRSDAGGNGFSFHLAREGNAPMIELPVKLDLKGGATVRLALDPGGILSGMDFNKDGNSTHSRNGDPVAERMKRNLTNSFTVLSAESATSPAVSDGAVVSKTPPPQGTRPYDLKPAKHLPKVELPADNPLTEEGVALGSRLFHEPRFSINNTVSCASCHQQATGFSDARKFSIGAEGHAGKRRSMPIVNLAWQRSFFWDGRAPSLREQVLMPIRDPHEMNEKPENVAEKLGNDPVYQKSFREAFGSEGVTVPRMALALEQFLLTNISQQSRFDLALGKAGDLTETEKRGLQLFVTENDPERGLRGADCFHCHGGMLFTDHGFHDNGLDLSKADIGRMAVTGSEADRGKFKTPSLRNVALRAPYMHDGRFATLEEVVEHYNSGVERRPNLDPNLAKHPAAGLGLTDEEKAELVAFLRTLTDQSFITPSPQDRHERP
jgi:cytochrome c peroxidase